MKTRLPLPELEAWLKAHNYAKNRFDHWEKTTEGKKYRYVVSNVALRLEVQVEHAVGLYNKASKSWVRLRSNYLKNITIVDGKLCGLRRDGCQVSDSKEAKS